MKKVVLFIFLIASVIVSAKTLVSSNSLSPPQSLGATLKAQLQMLQLSAETQQLDVVLFERDVSRSVSFENYLAISETLNVQNAVIFQINNQNANIFGKTDVLLQAVSPKCRAVMQVFSCDNVITQRAASSVIQAVSPSCRDVLLLS